MLPQPVRGQIAQRGDDRRVARASSPPNSTHSPCRTSQPAAAFDLGHQPRLADPGLAGDQHDRAADAASASLSARSGTSRPIEARCSTVGILVHPRPMKGIFVAITVMNCTLASSGSDAM